jgi:predicted amidohydrolase
MIPKSFLYNEQAASKHLKVITVAMSCDRDPDANRIRITSALDRIAQAHPDADLVVFGEMILGWYNPDQMPEYHHRISEPISPASLRAFTSLAEQHGIHLCFGMSEIDKGTMYNAQVLLTPQGEIHAVHRKWNLKSGEKKANYQPGTVPVTITDIKGVKTAIVICSDAASPRVMRELMRSPVDMIILSLADDSDDDQFMAKLNARMYDAWIVTANRYGSENGRFWNGHMVISSPCGELRATGQDKEQFLEYELRFDEKQPWLKRAIRNTWVKTPLVWHILGNWKRAKSFL